MLIGELSSKTGLSRDTIRYYEKAGLIRTTEKDRKENNYKDYPQEVADRLLLINHAKSLGFTLNEIKGVIDLWQDNFLSAQDKIGLLNKKIEEIDSKIERLNHMKDYLKTRINLLQNGCGQESHGTSHLKTRQRKTR